PAPRSGKRFAPRWLTAAGIFLSPAGLTLLTGLTPASHSPPLTLIATITEGIGTGIASPPILATTLRAGLPSHTGAASAAGSAAGQLGSSIGAALLNTIAATPAAAHPAAHPAAAPLTGTLHRH